MLYLSTLLLSMFLTICLIPAFMRLAIRLNNMDIPNARKVHTCPIPKCGGIAMALGALVPVTFMVPGGPFVRAVLMGAGIVVLFGLIDDRKNLGWRTKFMGQIAAALVVILYGGIKINFLGMLLPDGVYLSDWIAVPLTLVVIVGVTNAINLSDGLDGLAGGICLLSFICIGYLAYQGERTVIALLSVAIVGAIFGFLRFNTYPAILFMGDAGSQLLGFLAVTLSLGLTQGNTPLSPVLPLILLGFPVLDTVTVMVERISEGRPPFAADKKHFHHKLMRLGLYHTESVFVIYLIQCFLVTWAFVFRFYSEWLLLIFYLVFSGITSLGFFVADKTGFKLKREGFFDLAIKKRLKVIREKNLHIKISFKIVELGFPLLLFITCLMPRSVPLIASYVCFGLLGVFLVIRLINKEWLGPVIGVSLYFFVPFLIYTADTNMASWIKCTCIWPCNLSFGVLALFVILTLKFTERKRGFAVTPMHFLVIFVALVVPNLPGEWIQHHNMGLVAAKIVILFFTYEVLAGELRGDLKKLWGGVMVSMAVVGIRGLI